MKFIDTPASMHETRIDVPNTYTLPKKPYLKKKRRLSPNVDCLIWWGEKTQIEFERVTQAKTIKFSTPRQSTTIYRRVSSN